MKKIELANNISFCFGVQKSLKLIDHLLTKKNNKNIYMLGEIIHNEQVINELTRKGLRIIKNVNSIPKIPKNSIVIIQSHGVGPHVYDNLKKRKIPYIDSTCPLVKKIHKSIYELEQQGYYPLILGSKKHTEVIGISGYVKQNPIIITDKKDIKPELFKNIKKIGIVMQSTFFFNKVNEIVQLIQKYVSEIKIIDTICEPTKLRQKEISQKAPLFTSVVVVGSSNSSNTNKLYKISKSKNKNTFLITSETEIKQYNFVNLQPVFLASGASTPLNFIDKVKQQILEQSNAFNYFSIQYQEKIDKTITQIFRSKIKKNQNPQIQNILKSVEEFCLRPGKRIRPLLLLWGYFAFGGKKRNIQEIIKLAAIIEIMHAFLLIHDDVIDNSKTRRGKDSFHCVMKQMYAPLTYNAQIGRDLAIIVGDLLFSFVIEEIGQLKINNEKKNQFLKYFGQCYSFTCIGQIYDIQASQLKTIENKKYSNPVAVLKTAYYTIYYPILMGYSLIGTKKNYSLEIKKMAIPLGLAFQMRDDIISLFGKKTGKSNDADIYEGKITIVIEETLKKLTNQTQTEFKTLFLKQKKSKSDIEKIKKFIVSSGSIKSVQKKIFNKFKICEKQLLTLDIAKKYKKIIFDLIENLSHF